MALVLRGVLAAALLAAAARATLDQCPNAFAERNCTGPKSSSEFFANLQASGYDKSRRPPCRRGNHEGPTIVQVQFKLTQLNKIDAKLGTIAVNGYLRTWWKDPRLKFDGKIEDDPDSNGCVEDISIPGTLYSEPAIWMPDIFISNLVSRDTDGADSLTQISPDGTVWHSEQSMLVLKMDFDLGRLPFDYHTASVRLASYSQDIRKMRLVAKGGTANAAESGIGVDAAPVTSTAWSFVDNGATAETEGFTTPGRVEVIENWDYVDLWWQIARKPRFYIMQVVVPCTLFLIVSFIQFFVDRDAVPARASLAVIPVLIMRTMSNSIYASLPEGSHNMWLDDFVTTSMILCIVAAIHFGLVQFLRMFEKRHAKKLDGLKQCKETTAKLVALVHEKRVPLVTILKEYAPEDKKLTCEEIEAQTQLHQRENAAMQEENAAVQESAPVGDAEGTPSARTMNATGSHLKRSMKVRSEAAKNANVMEADLVFIEYAKDIFNRYDEDGTNSMNPQEVRKALTYFDIHLSSGQCHRAMCKFLRDHGQPTPADESQASLTFSDFVGFLLKVETYTLKRLPGWRHMRAFFQSMPPSERCDVAGRYLFPLVIGLQYLVFYNLIDIY